MNYKLENVKECLDPLQRYIIFGAGAAGKKIGWYLENILNNNRYCYCDNNIKKQDESLKIPVYSVERAVMIKNAIFIVGFIGNMNAKISSAVNCLKEYSIENKNILFVDMNFDFLESNYIEHASKYIDNLLENRRNCEKIHKVKQISFITSGFDAIREQSGGGGPVGAICVQKSCLGSSYKDINIRYPYCIDNEENNNCFNKYPFITGAIESVRRVTEKDKDTIYVANDIFSAFGLYTMGKNYCILFHAQGDVVKEMTLWGKRLTQREKELIYKIEYIAAENACYVLFPSAGAEQYFRGSFEKPINFNGGSPLYNTISDFPVAETVNNLERDNNTITFLSIGQMTSLKGMDRIPGFIESLSNYTDQKIRWIAVADGILKDGIRTEMNAIMQRKNNIEYINIDYKIDHSQIFYLFSICDIYLMLHRVSIFDFSTLEAMFLGKAIILSNIQGNDEYNKECNIKLVGNEVNWNDILEVIRYRDLYGSKNKEVYNKYFSKPFFIKRYNDFFEKFIKKVENI